VQVNAGWQLQRAAPAALHTALVNPVFGLGNRAELGTTFGYQWRDEPPADGVTGLAFATKLRLWGADGGFKVSTRLDLKLPTASDARGLGTGNVDFGATLIATRCWGATCLDANVGYTAVDGSRVVFGDDQYFVGLAARREASARWTLVGESYAVLPHGSPAPPVAVHFDLGAQLAATDDLVLSILVGSAIGRGSPDLTGFLGFSCVL
jgi:hypothetical protein